MKCTLADYIQEVNIKTTKNNEYPILTSSRNGVYLQSEYFNKQVASNNNIGYKIIEKGQFTYRAMSDTGKFYLNRLTCIDKGIVSPAYPVFKILDETKLLGEYLQLYFRSNKFQNKISLLSRGSTRTSIKLNTIKNILLDIPNISVQEKIISNIKVIEDVIELRKNQLEKLDLLVKSRFRELFGDLRINNKNWMIYSFRDFAKIDTNMVKDLKRYRDYPHIGINNIEKNTGNLLGYKTVMEDNIISGKYLFTPEHIIYSKIRPNLNKVAVPNFYGVCSADAYPILVKKTICNRIFLAYTMRSNIFLDYIITFSKRTNLPKVNKQQVEGFNCPLPPIELQNKFADFVQKIDKSKVEIQKSLDKLEMLKKSLMQQYFG